MKKIVIILALLAVSVPTFAHEWKDANEWAGDVAVLAADVKACEDKFLEYPELYDVVCPMDEFRSRHAELLDRLQAEAEKHPNISKGVFSKQHFVYGASIGTKAYQDLVDIRTTILMVERLHKFNVFIDKNSY